MVPAGVWSDTGCVRSLSAGATAGRRATSGAYRCRLGPLRRADPAVAVAAGQGPDGRPPDGRGGPRRVRRPAARPARRAPSGGRTGRLSSADRVAGAPPPAPPPRPAPPAAARRAPPPPGWGGRPPQRRRAPHDPPPPPR